MSGRNAALNDAVTGGGPPFSGIRRYPRLFPQHKSAPGKDAGPRVSGIRWYPGLSPQHNAASETAAGPGPSASRPPNCPGVSPSVPIFVGGFGKVEPLFVEL